MTKPPKKLLCSVCGEPADFSLVKDDGRVIGFCANHLPKEIYDELRDEGWDVPPPKPVH
jgi:hypothetical protein